MPLTTPENVAPDDPVPKPDAAGESAELAPSRDLDGEQQATTGALPGSPASPPRSLLDLNSDPVGLDTASPALQPTILPADHDPEAAPLPPASKTDQPPALDTGARTGDAVNTPTEVEAASSVPVPATVTSPPTAVADSDHPTTAEESPAGPAAEPTEAEEDNLPRVQAQSGLVENKSEHRERDGEEPLEVLEVQSIQPSLEVNEQDSAIAQEDNPSEKQEETPSNKTGVQEPPSSQKAEEQDAEKNTEEGNVAASPSHPPSIVVQDPSPDPGSTDVGPEGSADAPSLTPPALGEESKEALGVSHPVSMASADNLGAPGSHANLSRGSIVFVVKALETIDKSKEARKNDDIKKAAEDALAMAARASVAKPASSNSPAGTAASALPYAELDARVIFEPLRLACATGSNNLVPTSIDCIGKLISFDFFAEPDLFTNPQTDQKESLAEVVTNTVCDALTESADAKTELQIIKALLMVVVSDTSHIHQASLLKAIRTVYNIFLSSRNPANQVAAQVSLTQMVHHVFSHIPLGAPVPAPGRSSPRPETAALSPTVSQNNLTTVSQSNLTAVSSSNRTAPSMEELTTLQALEQRKSFQAGEMLTPQTAEADLRELYIKDAFLVLRTLCKLSMKALSADDERDPKSQGMKSKILSLHLVYVILKRHMAVFADPSVTISAHSNGEQSSFIHAVKQYIFLSLSRNAVSPVNQVFQLAVEIFWLTLDGLRPFVKKELEVLLNEIFLPILEMRTATPTQKSILLSVLLRLCQNPQALVEVYINYDCDRSALENVYERFINIVSKISQTQLGPTLSAPEPLPLVSLQKGDEPGLAALGLQPHHVDTGEDVIMPVESHLKRQSLECLAAVLHSLVQWASRNTVEDETASSAPRDSLDSAADTTLASPVENGTAGSPHPAPTVEVTGQEDDPSRLQSAKARKTMLLEGIRLFNDKPNRGITFLVQNHFIPSSDPKEIARFLLYADGLDKARIGEYLGSGEPAHIATMHAFVDMMDFKDLHLLTALRRFLQTFRLPGEAQMIDRFLLKFAERYVMGNPGVFATADTAYTFAYSIILLNTDAHNPQVKNRMTLEDFIRNNRGIDAGNSLSDEYQREAYESIVNHEIKMKDEVSIASPAPAIAAFIAGVGRDPQRAAYEAQSEGMASKTEALFRSMVRARRRIGPEQRAEVERFFSASHMDHVKPMFEVAWMPILAGLSGPMQETSDMEIVRICLAAFADAIHTSCLFDLELERNAFVTTLAKLTNLNNLAGMKPKHVEAIKCLLGIAQTEGNYLKSSWREVLACVSQLERFQLISGGVDESQLPDLGRRQPIPSAPVRNTLSNAQALAALFSSSTSDLRSKVTRLPANDVVEAGASTEVTVAADKVFSQTPQLSGTAIVDFVEALCAVSWEEIQSSGMAESPRLFSLQKLVEISYYNMNRIRIEWSEIWAILGDHFNNVLVTNQLAISTFAVDSLRQLATKFLEKEELPGFAFQKDFLRPFAYAMRNSPEVETREMIIDCLTQMVQAQSGNIRSGWVSIFAILSAASVDSLDKITQQAFDMVQTLFNEHLASILQVSFVDLASCLASFAQSRSQRISLQSVGLLRSIIPSLSSLAEAAEEGDESVARLTGPEAQLTYWFPVLNALVEIVLRAADLEVRRVALDSLFELVNLYAPDFQPAVWDAIVHDILFSIFGLIRGEQVPLQEDMTVWLSTTMVQALRSLIELWTSNYVRLERYLPELLELLELCIVQENDTLARIGTSSFQQLLENNVAHFSRDQWVRIVDVIIRLFHTTAPTELFDPMLIAPEPTSPPPPTEEKAPDSLPRLPDKTGGLDGPLTSSERRKVFKQVIMRCVLQLLLIETVNELLQHKDFYSRIPADQLLRLLEALQESYAFAKRFNVNKDLRVSLWKLGFMRQLPNLLRQESTAASTLVSLLLRMLQDEREEHVSSRAEVRARFVPLGHAIATQFVPLDAATQARNIASWMPVVTEVFLGVAGMNDEVPAPSDRAELQEDLHTFSYYAPMFYPTAMDLLTKPEMSLELLQSLRDFFYKVGLVSGLCPHRAETSLPLGPSLLSPVMESSEASTFPSRQHSAMSPPDPDPVEFSTDIFDVPDTSQTTDTHGANVQDGEKSKSLENPTPESPVTTVDVDVGADKQQVLLGEVPSSASAKDETVPSVSPAGEAGKADDVSALEPIDATTGEVPSQDSTKPDGEGEMGTPPHDTSVHVSDAGVQDSVAQGTSAPVSMDTLADAMEQDAAPALSDPSTQAVVAEEVDLPAPPEQLEAASAGPDPGNSNLPAVTPEQPAAHVDVAAEVNETATATEGAEDAQLASSGTDGNMTESAARSIPTLNEAGAAEGKTTDDAGQPSGLHAGPGDPVDSTTQQKDDESAPGPALLVDF